MTDSFPRQQARTRHFTLGAPRSFQISADGATIAFQRSRALLAAGRPHTVLPLTGVTHMPSQEEVAENLLLLQVDFLRNSLGEQGRNGAA